MSEGIAPETFADETGATPFFLSLPQAEEKETLVLQAF
jgi:hypothetical protein